MLVVPVLFFGLLASLLAVQPAAAAPITVHFDAALLEITGPEPLPVQLGFPNNLRLRFHVPEASSILSLNSIDFSVEVYDDDDSKKNPNDEEGDIVFVVEERQGKNFVVGSFGPGLNGFTNAAPLTVGGSVDSSKFPQILAEIQDDGFFLLRVNRNGGDFYVKSGTVTIDAELAAVPEPGTCGLIGLALGACFAARRKLKA